jgi:hypothetical protein
VQDTPMDVEENSSDKPVGKSQEQETIRLDGTARWQQSFIEHEESNRSSRLVIWLVVGVVLVIVVTFVLAA